MKALKPKTKPTDDQRKQMAESLRSLIDDCGGTTKLSEMTGIPFWTITSWLRRKKISAEYAQRLCSVPEIKALGYSKEALRPDVTAWETKAQRG